MGTKKRSSPTETTELLLPERQADTRLNLPPLYKVYVLNDDYTPMDFVVEVLMRYFLMDHAVATQVMLQIHQKGRANCGLYTREIAETKVVQVNEYARRISIHYYAEWKSRAPNKRMFKEMTEC